MYQTRTAYKNKPALIPCTENMCKLKYTLDFMIYMNHKVPLLILLSSERIPKVSICTIIFTIQNEKKSVRYIQWYKKCILAPPQPTHTKQIAWIINARCTEGASCWSNDKIYHPQIFHTQNHVKL